MANLKDLIVNGTSRFIGKVYSSSGFVGNLEGTASNASKVNNLTVQTAVPSGAVFTDTKAASSLTVTSGNYGGSSATTSLQTALNNLTTAVGGKQATLTAQTAYSAKGSATKVPQITTNSLGQVTGVTEVTITQPDISGKMDKANPTGTGSFSLNRKENTTVGSYSFAEGKYTTASGEGSHAEGIDTMANGTYSHAEGNGTMANTSNSHAEGWNTTASGNSSHAEGYSTIASGMVSHAEGNGTIARGTYQHVQGKYNIDDAAGTYAHIIGGGTSDTARKNIHTIDWSGNAEFAGTVSSDGNKLATETWVTNKGYLTSHQDISGKYNSSDVGLTTMKVTRGSSVATTTNGFWSAMCNTVSTGSPTLPSAGKWWHVISMDWSGNDVNNWYSQLALPTQDGGVPHYRKNNAGGTSINSSTWHSFITDENIGSQSVSYAASAGSATDSTKLPLAGGTMTGRIEFKNTLNNYGNPRIYINGSTLILEGAKTGTSGGAGLETSLQISSCAAGILPGTGAGTTSSWMTLGSSSRKFGTVYSVATSLNSDIKLKKDIELLNNDNVNYNDFFDNINFVKFRWKDNYNMALETAPSSRYHYGIIAQDVEELMHSYGISNYDNGFIHANFFLDNTSNAYIIGGYRKPKEGYDYSQNVWDYKHNMEYNYYNEVIEKKFSELDVGEGYKHRHKIQYLLFQDISKVRAEGKQPSLKINSVNFIDKDGNYHELTLTGKGISCYDPDDKEFKNPHSNCIKNEDGSITIEFNEMWSSYMIKIAENDNCPDFYDYDSVIADIDFIGEYKMYLIPKGEYQTCDFWHDRDRTDKICYDYTFNYQELTNMSLAVLQDTRKEYKEYKETTDAKIAELEEKLQYLLDKEN